MRSKPKNQCQHLHAKMRAKERYDLDFNRSDRKELVNLIRDNKSLCITKQSLRVTIHTIMFKDTLVRVVYDKDRKTIVSFLPL